MKHELERLGARYELSVRAVSQLERFAHRLASDPLAPTAVRAPVGIARDHLADALVALAVPEVRAAIQIADLGSGSGVPGLPLAIALPTATVALVESNHRKAAFIARAIETCEVENAHVVPLRAEAWTEGRERCDLVTARALAALPVVAEYAAPLLRIGGALLAWRGRRDPDEERAAATAAAVLGLRVGDALPVEPYPGVRNRHLQLFLKIASTPPRFPRRPGVARKRPLGG